MSDTARDLAGLAAGAELSLYVHVPFCWSLCDFCACNWIITKRAEAPARWLDTVEREIAMAREALPGTPRVVQHHWGGGTPTHLEPIQIRRLFRTLDDAFPATATAELSIEVDPRVATEDHVEALRACGFGRLSMGVQDLDARVQAAIHRVQSVAATAALAERARAAGFASVGFDLIYGLPFQTVCSMERTLDEVIAIAPDRIALYGYAHVTWVAKQQRGFERRDLPSPPERLRIQLAAIRKLLAAGYEPVGMDHFARPDDELAHAARSRSGGATSWATPRGRVSTCWRSGRARSANSRAPLRSRTASSRSGRTRSAAAASRRCGAIRSAMTTGAASG